MRNESRTLSALCIGFILGAGVAVGSTVGIDELRHYIYRKAFERQMDRMQAAAHVPIRPEILESLQRAARREEN